ncbi:hypothetical protein CAPTEDRAFT_189088 [Capitella teleta]|uniref:Uncharacterized protein n=1 Tax=Capitella teleta TaxID=283909 RepID=R7T3R1_CAPTE|nr:hypothetical protein CAPTEDRAFT_189088 [Capitella teleta]|eukprot:ELT87296.1 hypothetical protein CAPTEDRAFT_189088 [Capitella teleta]
MRFDRYLLEARLESQEALIASNNAKISAVSVTSSPRPVAQSYAAAAAANIVTNAANAPSESASSAARAQPLHVDPNGRMPMRLDCLIIKFHYRKTTRTGTKSGERCKSFTVGPEPSRDLFLFRVSPTAEEEDINNYLSEEGIVVRSLSKMSAAQSTWSSYRLEVKASDASQLLHGDFWPEGVRVRRFRRPREEAGAVPEVIDTETTTTTSEDGS